MTEREPGSLTWPRGLSGMCYGGDYNPEQWSLQVWAEDMELMRRAKVNLVTVGVFSWSRLEPSPGVYRFDWLDQVMDLLHQTGIRVNLATPTASPPPWFSFAHPDALPVTRDGVRLWHGSRDTYCVCAPAYREACRRIAQALADRYADHPALAMWHVHNEYGTWCYCDHVAVRFRQWLRARYGDLDALNEAWNGAFWSQWYSDWDQILPPRATQYLPNPTQMLDFRRFMSAELLAAYQEQRDILRAANPDIPITTNYMFYPGLDNWAWSQQVDLTALDHYPSATDQRAEEQTAFGADLARSWARGRPWLLMEQATSLIYTGDVIATKEPGRMLRHSLSHIARGSEGALFFQWRAPVAGAEVYHSAMVPHAGPATRVFKEVVALGEVLERLEEVRGSVPRTDVAILWDAEAWWAVESAGFPSTRVRYLDAVSAAHRVLWRAGYVVDFARPDADLSRYRLVLVPSLYVISDEAAANLTNYVANGGHLVVSFFSGIADPRHHVRLGGYPGAFRTVLGIRVEEFHPLLDDAQVTLSTGDTGRIWSEHLHLEGAEALAHYVGGCLDGQPALTRHRWGKGVGWYVSTRLDDDAYGRLVFRAAEEAGVTPPPTGASGECEVVRRWGAHSSWLFVINHSDRPHHIPAEGVDLVTGAEVRGQVSVPAGGVAVIREAR